MNTSSTRQQTKLALLATAMTVTLGCGSSQEACPKPPSAQIDGGQPGDAGAVSQDGGTPDGTTLYTFDDWDGHRPWDCEPTHSRETEPLPAFRDGSTLEAPDIPPQKPRD